MHSMRALPAHPDHQQLNQQHQQSQHQLELHHHQHAQANANQQHQQHHIQQPAQQLVDPQAAGSATSGATMTILEPLEHAHVQQPMGGERPAVVHVLMEPANQQQQHLVQQNLVQQQAPRLSPQLHQLQPPPRSLAELEPAAVKVEQSQEQCERQHQADAGGQQQVELRQRPAPIEGIVADGGGPIVQWLLDNYEIADGESLPRSTVYNHYLAHCRQLQMASVNAASFGKLIRSVFVGLKTRRLGTRGHSKYHYFGVRAKMHTKHELLLHQETSATCARDDNSNHNTELTGSDTDSLANGMECARLGPTSVASGTGSVPLKRAKRDAGQQQNGGYTRRAAAAAAAAAANAATASGQYYHHQESAQRDQQAVAFGAGDPQAGAMQLDGQHQQFQHQLGSCSDSGLTDHINGQSVYAYNNGLVATNGQQPPPAYSHHHLHHHNHHHQHNQSQQQPAQPINGREQIDFRNYLGANWPTLVDEHWPAPLPADLLQGKTIADETGAELAAASLLALFEANYKTYYARMVELLSELKFAEVEQLWHEFWHPNQRNQRPQSDAGQNQHPVEHGDEHQQRAANGCSEPPPPPPQPPTHNHLQYQPASQTQTTDLTFELMYQITSQPAIVERINQIDYRLYAALESFLLPDMLSPIPRPLAQHIRLFAKNFGSWVEQSVKDYELKFVAEKSRTAKAFGYSLRRCASLNHLSSASRAIWDRRSALAQMSMDLLRVDIRDIEHQVSLMGNGETHHDLNLASRAANSCNDDTSKGNNTNNNNQEHNYTDLHHNHVHRAQHSFAMQPAQLIQNFLALLEDSYPASSWPDWCRNLVESRVSGLSLEQARNFIFKWNFYISLIMKELTLKSAPSLGSFQLIRLLFDEYIYYLVVSRLAQAQNKTPAQLMRPNSK